MLDCWGTWTILGAYKCISLSWSITQAQLSGGSAHWATVSWSCRGTQMDCFGVLGRVVTLVAVLTLQNKSLDSRCLMYLESETKLIEAKKLHRTQGFGLQTCWGLKKLDSIFVDFKYNCRALGVKTHQK